MNYIQIENRIAKGKWRFIILHGVLGWGVTTALLISVFEYFMETQNFVASLSSYLAIFPLAGIAWGLVMWQRMNNDYHRQAGQFRKDD